MKEYTKYIQIKLTPKDRQAIEDRMKELGFSNISAYIRKMAIDGYVVKVDLSELKEILRLLKINSNNLNQYAKRANENGSIYFSDIKDLQKAQKQLVLMVGDLLERLSKL